MPQDGTPLRHDDAVRHWPEEGLTRLPNWLYTDPEIFAREMEIFHHGRTWSFVGLECEIPAPGAWLRSFVGLREVLAIRGENGEVHVVENRCAHRGAPVCWGRRGSGKELICPYHQWTYGWDGGLKAVPFEHGLRGKGGMPQGFDKSQHGLKRLRSAVRGGGVWASFSDETADFETYIGPRIIAAMDRNVAGRTPRYIGSTRHVIKCNWKLWLENSRDIYHATLLHTFLTNFGLLRADLPPAELRVDGPHLQATLYRKPVNDNPAKAAEAERQIRVSTSRLALCDMDTVSSDIDEYGDNKNFGYNLFPGAMFQQHLNVPSFRQILPKSPGLTEIVWSFFGYAGDDEALRRMRLKQANLLGPAGFVTGEDGEVLAKAQPIYDVSPDGIQILEMGGTGTECLGTMVEENAIRAMYQVYRELMQL